MIPTVKGMPDQEVAELGTQRFEDLRADKLMEHFRQKLAKSFGVTVIGPYVTLRDTIDGHHVSVTMQVSSLTSSGILTPHDPGYNQ